MCLASVDPVPARKYGVGYKVFEVRKGKLYPVYNDTRSFADGVWHTDRRTTPIATGSDTSYPTGFHIYLTPKVAKNNRSHRGSGKGIVRKVRFKMVVATGEQCGDKVVVARQMYIEVGDVG